MTNTYVKDVYKELRKIDDILESIEAIKMEHSSDNFVLNKAVVDVMMEILDDSVEIINNRKNEILGRMLI